MNAMAELADSARVLARLVSELGDNVEDVVVDGAPAVWNATNRRVVPQRDEQTVTKLRDIARELGYVAIDLYIGADTRRRDSVS